MNIEAQDILHENLFEFTKEIHTFKKKMLADIERTVMSTAVYTNPNRAKIQFVL